VLVGASRNTVTSFPTLPVNPTLTFAPEESPGMTATNWFPTGCPFSPGRIGPMQSVLIVPF